MIFNTATSAISPNEIGDRIRQLFDFEVTKLPLRGPDNMTTPWYGLFRSDTGMSVGGSSVSSRYVPHSTDDVISLVESAAAAFKGDVKLTCAFRDGHHVSVAPADDTRRTIYGTRDNIFPRIVISAGYNGSPFRAHMGYYRDLCDNLSILRTVQGTSVTIRHTKSLRDKMDRLLYLFNGLHKGWTTLGETIAHLENQTVDLNQFLLDVYGTPKEDSKVSKSRHKKRIEKIIQRVSDERHMSGREPLISPIRRTPLVSAWEAYNAVQGYAQHVTPRKGRREKTKFERIIMATSDRYVKAAESLAMSVTYV
jgi:hypothetical protein